MNTNKDTDITLVIGGARSGKSSYGEQLALSYGGERVYVATAEPFDDEMRQRIARHRKMREGRFSSTVEEAIDLVHALERIEDDTAVVLIDCVTVWLGNLLHHKGLQEHYTQIDRFVDFLPTCPFPLIIVANEVGQGIVPGDPMSRHFRDHAGWLNQSLSKQADKVIWMVAGIPVTIKGEEKR
jgi:adenosylcobinamide kinase/adenosylcobinamide-phosphate guanylyltransferase